MPSPSADVANAARNVPVLVTVVSRRIKSFLEPEGIVMDQSRSDTERSAQERRTEERDPLRAGVTALRAELVALQQGDHEKLGVRTAVGVLALQARKADVPPERLLIVLKRLADDSGLAHLNIWHRLILSEQLVQWAIASYYQQDP